MSINAKGVSGLKTRLAASLGVLLLVLSSCTQTEVADPVAAKPQWLFVVQSEGDTGFDAQSGELSIPTSAVTAFTDRPYRDATTLQPEEFVSLWQDSSADGFTADPPNAILSYWEDADASSPRSVVCEIVGGVSFDAASGRMLLGIKVLEPVGLKLPSTMARASLFVDDGTWCPNSPEDETNVEWLNMNFFEDAFSLYVSSTASGGYQIRLDCPEENPTLTEHLEVKLSLGDGPISVSCYDSSDVMTLSASDLDVCQPSGECLFSLTASNRQTLYVYSKTLFSLAPKNGLDYVPALNPATECPAAFSFSPIILGR
jgi:hypothetical protein